MLDPLRPENIGVLAGAVPLPRGVEIRGFDDAAQVAGALGIAADWHSQWQVQKCSQTPPGPGHSNA